jgi:hypothetical protein
MNYNWRYHDIHTKFYIDRFSHLQVNGGGGADTLTGTHTHRQQDGLHKGTFIFVIRKISQKWMGKE